MNRLFAIVILSAVAISVAAAVIPWMTSTMTWRPEILKILEADLYTNNSDGRWHLRIVAANWGETAAEIYKVEIHGIETIELSPPKTIAPGTQKEIDIELEKDYAEGAMYTIRLYLKSGSVYPVLERVVTA
uniref:Uncharacterized protein n=1 Tax=Ignisphaera aggregans TaxID=334771 RepID=A0A7C2Z859_9CREN